MNQENMERMVGQLVGDLGGAFGTPLVRIGDKLGLYRTLDEIGPATAKELASVSNTAERYVREWLGYNAASGYVDYDRETERFSLNEEQALLFAREDSTAYMVPAFHAAAAYLDNQPKVEKAFKDGSGVAWGEQSGCLFCAVAGFFRPGYVANLINEWLPSLDGVVERLEQGGQVADVGCGHGHSTVLMAEAFPNSDFIGIDFHQDSIDEARKHAEHHGFPNLSFETAEADAYGGQYDLVTSFDCVHDMGDPGGVANHVRRSLKPGGKWMIVEPKANDSLADNLNPVSRLYYAASTMVCVPSSLAQPRGAALGAQAGPARLRDEIVGKGGFSDIRVATETPFNLVLEATV